MANELMFQIGIQEVKEKIDDIRKKFDDFEQKYGKSGEGLTVKLNLQGAITEADSLIGALKNIGSAESLKPYENELGKVKQQMEQFANASKTAADANKKAIETSADSVNQENIEKQRQLKLLAEVRDMYMKVAETSSATSGVSARTIKETEQQYASLLAKLSTIPPKTPIQEIAAEFQALKSSTKKFFDDVKQGTKAVDNIRSLRFALKQVNEQINSGKSSPKLEGLREQLQAINKEMHNMIKAGNYGGIQSLFAGHKGMSDGVVNMIRQAVSEMNKLGASTQSTAAITSQLTSEEQRLASAIGHSTGEMRGQSQVLSDLKSYAKQYLSVWGTQSFINKIIETGGLLEQQRMAIGAILGDLSHANTLFGQIKNLALKSPFGVVQLDTMSKQLTAYNFQYSELYDWTKRLADISAATGTEVSRLSLALGHVKSEGALSGYTLRQFAMGNVPLLQTLAKQLGKTTSEIRKMTRNKEIGYDAVAEALKSLTENGGMFENAQEIMSGALNAKFKNLRDAFDIMYGEMAESGLGDTLKGVATTLTVLAKNWEMTGGAILSVVGTLGLHRVAQMLSNKMMTQANLITGQFTAKQMEAQAITGNLTRKQLLQAVASGRVAIADAEAAAATLGLSKAQLQAVASSGKVSAAYSMLSVSIGRLTVHQLALMKLFKGSSWFSATKYVTGFRLAVDGIAAGFRVAGMAVKGFLASAWPLLAITAAIETYMHFKQKRNESAERVKSLQEAANEGMKNLQGQIASYKVGSSVGLDSKQITSSIEDMQQILKDYSSQSGNQINEAFRIDEKTGKSVHSLAEQYEILAKAIQDTNESYKEMGKISDVFEQVNNDSEGTWDDSFRKNTEEYVEALKDRNRAEVDFLSKNRTAIINAIEETRKAYSGYNDIIKMGTDLYVKSGGKDGFAESDIQAQVELLRSNSKYFEYFDQQIRKAGDDAFDSWAKFNTEVSKTSDAYGEMDKDLQTFTSSAVKRLEVIFGKTVDQWTNAQKQAVQKSLEIFMTGIDGYSNLSDKERKEIEERLLKPFNIPIDADVREANKAITGLISSLNDLVGRDWVVKLGLDKSTDALNAVEKLDKKYKEAKEGMERIGTSLAGQTFKNGRYVLPESSSVVIRPTSSKSNIPNAPWQSNKTEVEYNERSEASATERLALQYNQLADSLDATTEAYKGLNIAAPKDNKANAAANKNANDYAKGVREKIRIMKEAADAYQYWREKVGDDAAFAHVEDEFGKLLASIGLTTKDAKDLRKNLLSLTPEISGIKDKKVQRESLKERDKELAQLDRKDFEKDVDKFASKVQIELDSLTRAWEVFNSVREATGNVDLAVQISGVDYQNGKNRNLADALKKQLEQEFITFGGGIKFDLGLSDDEIEKQIQAAMPEQAQEAIKGLVAEYKKWRDLQRDVLRKDVDVFSKLIGSSVDYQSEIQKINDKYKEQLESLQDLRDLGEGNVDENGNKGISKEQYERAKDVLDTTTDQERWTKETAYINLMNNSLAMTRDEIMAAADVQENLLNRRLMAGLMTVQQYEEEMAKLKKIMNDWNTSGFLGSKSATGAFLSGGNQGLLDYYQRMASKARSEYANAEYKDSPEAQEKEEEAKHYDDLYTSLVKLSEGAKKVYTGFQTLQGGLDLIGNLFESMGWEGGSNAMGDAGDLLGGALSGASSLSALGPWGMAAGAGLGFVSGLFALHDKSIQREIDALKENNAAIEANTDAIKRSRERTLGYDEGKVRRYLANNYSDVYDYNLFVSAINGRDTYTVNNAKLAMQEYYKRNGVGTGYQQELANLKEERKNYLKMYNLEKSKKNVSEEALQEYKTKIAELDDQIIYFAEDITNELFSIDLKGWADEIGDALMTAFENGEDAAEAFNNSVQDIMRQVLRKMLNLGIIEPMMTKLRNKLFGENGKPGIFDASNPEGTIDAAMREVTAFFGEGGEGQKMIEATKLFYDNWEDFMRGYGLTLSSDESNSSSSRSIKSITEQTADLLASYVNGIRADVSVNRAIIAEYFPMFLSAMTRGNSSLANIENYTAAIMRSNDIIADKISSLDNNIIGLKNKAWKVPFA